MKTKTIYQNLQDATNTMFRKRYGCKWLYFFKQEISQINNQTFYLKKPEKEEPTKCKAEGKK